MRLLRIRLSHFRGVHDREVTLAEDGITVLQGENEVGKTTTVRALDLLVDAPDSSRRADVRAAAPAGIDAGPEVEAEILTGPYRFVYRKRWLRRPLTELTLTAPAALQLTGAEAHARVVAILDETMDRDLWRALRVEQHTPAGQARLGGHDALTRALDRAAGGPDAAAPANQGTHVTGTAHAGTDSDLVERAEAELRRYRTPNGRPTGELREAEERSAGARVEHERCRHAVDAVEDDVAERERLDAESAALDRRRREHQAHVAELEDRWSGLQSRLREVETAHGHAVLLRERAESAGARAQARRALVAAADEAARTATRTGEIVAEHHDARTAARKERDARHAEHQRARTAAGLAREQARAADAALARAHDHAELADLEARLQRVADAEEGRRAADAELAAISVDEDTVETLDRLARDVLRAEAAQEAGSARVELVVPDTAAGAPELRLDGEPAHLAPGQTRRLPVRAALSVSLPGQLDVHVRPGRDGHALADAVRAAVEELATACADAGVVGPDAARAALRRAEDARRHRHDHELTVDRELAGRSLAEVRAARETLRDRLGGSDAAPATVRTDGVPDREQLRAAATTARAAADDAAAHAEETDHLRGLAEEAVREVETTAALAAQRAADARHAHECRAAELTDARTTAPDAELDTDAADGLARAREAENAHESLAAALAADDPDSVEALVVNARRVDERLNADTVALDRTRAETTGRLQSAGHQGWHDQLLAAEIELDAATREHTAVARRARAAHRLHDTLLRHRDAVRRAYVAPFRSEVERLARIVFGPSLSLEVDEALRITHRTLAGVTVPFDELSSGAQEQLALCARLACAALVDPADGVPVVIDDALGHSDPDRLARLGAVFTAATSRGAGQILVLTCTPERYRGVGAATVVALTPSRPPAREPAREPMGWDRTVATREVARDVGEDPPAAALPPTG